MAKVTGLYCQNCGGRMFVGSQYYAMQTYFIDITCLKCSYSRDVDVRKLNKLLINLGFMPIEEHHVFKEADKK